MTMQGGFVPYHLHNHNVEILEKFVGQDSVATFNMNGARKETKSIVDSNNIRELYFAGKNVCHTIEFSRDRLKQFVDPPNRAAELFLECAEMYFKKHDSKKFHDPVAAVCHLHPSVGTWIKGKPFYKEGKWGTQLDTVCDSKCNALVDIDRERFWHYITSFAAY
jgi:pyrimidine-specific ribonucleoside hydrolase